MATPQITRHSVAPRNSQYFSIQSKSANGIPTKSNPQKPIQIKGIPNPGRLPFSIPTCATNAATCPFDFFRRSFPFPAAAKQYLSPINSQRERIDWCGRKCAYPKIIHCPPTPSLNPKGTTYEELKGICTSDLELPLPKQPSPCEAPIPHVKKGSTGHAKKKSGKGSGSGSGSGSKSTDPYGSSPYGSGKGSYPYGSSSPAGTGYGQIEGTTKDSNELSGYWPSGGSYVPKEVRMKQQKDYGYSDYDYPQYPYGDSYPYPYPYSDNGYPYSGSNTDETESEVVCKKGAKSRSDEGLDFVFNPENDMATELTVTIEPDEPDMLEYALDNGILPVICGYLPPSIIPCQGQGLDGKKTREESVAPSGSYNPSGYGYSGYDKSGKSGSGSGGYPSYSGYGYGGTSEGSSSEPSTESSEYETVYTYATEEKIAGWQGSGSSSGSGKKKRKGSRVSDDLSFELRQADKISSSGSGSSS